MSSVVLGLGASHTTLMNTAWDAVAGLERAERYRSALAEARARVVAAEADVAVVVGSNHFRGLYLDLMPTFTIGVGEVHGVGEHGTPAGPQATDAELAAAMHEGLLDVGFDLALGHDLHVDHGITHAIQHVLPAGLPIVPLIVNCFAPPLPSPARCAGLGDALAEFLLGDGLGRRVVVVASGGLSHQLPFPDWRLPESDDDRFLVGTWHREVAERGGFEVRRRRIVTAAPPCLAEDYDTELLAALADGSLARLLDGPAPEAVAGNGAAEVRSWLVMAAACGWAPGEVLAYSPMPEWLTGMAVAAIPHPRPRGGLPS